MLDDPEVYVMHQDAMGMDTRRNYIRDRMRTALIYISEYAETQKMLTENRYRQEDLRAVFGWVDRIQNKIDQTLQQDDAHRRRRDMRFVLVPTRFPSTESMGQGDVTVWTNWIWEETNVIMNQLDEEVIARGYPDDPFNGSANGVFHPLRENFSLPPPVQTPRRQTNYSRHSDSSRKLLEECNKREGTKSSKESQTDVRTQGVVRETGKH